MPLSAGGSTHDAGGHELGETVVGCVERREPGDRTSANGDDHLLTGPDPIDVLAQTVLEVADADL